MGSVHEVVHVYNVSVAHLTELLANLLKPIMNTFIKKNMKRSI